MTPQEFIVEFTAQHSKAGPPVLDGRTKLFADGAALVSQGELVPPQPCDPPAERIALLKLKRRYCELRLKKELADFHQFQAESLQQNEWAVGGGCPPAPGNAAAQLMAGAERIQLLRDDLAAIDRELKQLPEVQAHDAYWEDRRQRERTLASQKADILSVQI